MPQTYSSARDEVEAFKRRQSEDLKRHRPFEGVQRRKRFYDRYKELKDDEDHELSPEHASPNASDEGEESWRNSEGERLRDFGVDEDVDFYDEEDVPLAVIIEQRRQRKQIVV
jgi:palmitoyltransferase